MGGLHEILRKRCFVPAAFGRSVQWHLYDSKVFILDANQLGASDIRNSPRFHAYQKIAAHLGTVVLLPRVSFTEHLQRYKASVANEMISVRDMLISEGRTTLEYSMSDKEINEHAYSVALNYGSEIEDWVRVSSQYTSAQYQQALERELWRVPPAHPTKGEGARDVLVWFDVLDSRGDETVYLISSDTHAFGFEGILRDELVEEFGGGAIAYFNDLAPLTKHLELAVPAGVAAPDLTQVTRDAVALDLNSPGMFVHLNAHIPPEERQLRAWTSHWDGELSLEPLQENYNFSLDGEHYFCYTQRYRATKSYVMVSMESALTTPVPWHFRISGAVTVSIRYSDDGAVAEFEVLGAKLDDRKTTMQYPSNEVISIAEAQRRQYPS
jgi:hypothetical protein